MDRERLTKWEDRTKDKAGGVAAQEGVRVYRLGSSGPIDRRFKRKDVKKEGLVLKAKGLLVQNPGTGFYREPREVNGVDNSRRRARFPDMFTLK